MEIFHVTFATTTSSRFEISRYLLKLVNFSPDRGFINCKPRTISNRRLHSFHAARSLSNGTSSSSSSRQFNLEPRFERTISSNVRVNGWSDRAWNFSQFLAGKNFPLPSPVASRPSRQQEISSLPIFHDPSPSHFRPENAARSFLIDSAATANDNNHPKGVVDYFPRTAARFLETLKSFASILIFPSKGGLNTFSSLPPSNTIHSSHVPFLIHSSTRMISNLEGWKNYSS